MKIADSVPIPAMLEMYIIKKKNEANVYKLQSEKVQFLILGFKSKETLEVIVLFNLGIT
jgi:hypothetical protein